LYLASPNTNFQALYLHPPSAIKFYRVETLFVLAEIQTQASARDLSSLKYSYRLWCPPSLLFIGYRGSFSETKRPGP